MFTVSRVEMRRSLVRRNKPNLGLASPNTTKTERRGVASVHPPNCQAEILTEMRASRKGLMTEMPSRRFYYSAHRRSIAALVRYASLRNSASVHKACQTEHCIVAGSSINHHKCPRPPSASCCRIVKWLVSVRRLCWCQKDDCMISNFQRGTNFSRCLFKSFFHFAA